MPFADADGIRIHYEVHGDGPPLVLAHGWGASARSNWTEPGWTALLAHHRRVLALDIRGHGRSDAPRDPAAYTYAAMAADVLAVLDHAGAERAEFIGYSLGAFSGMHLLGHHAHRIVASVLIGIGDETEESAAMGAHIATALRADDVDALSPAAKAVRRYVEQEPGVDLEALAVSAEVMWPDGFPLEIGGTGLAELEVPVLVLNGADDEPYVRSDQRLVDAMPSARLVRVPGADHLSGVTDERFRREVVRVLGIA